MKEQPKRETHYAQEVWVNPETESLRKNECLCLNCGNFNPGQPNNCSIAQSFYEICVKENIALIVTRCPVWACKQKNSQGEIAERKIRSELTHEQDVALVHPLLHKEILERIDKNLNTLKDYSKIVVPLKERKPNRVDELTQEIKKIQKGCSHEFRLLKPIDLKESKVKGFFIISDASLGTYDLNPSIFTARCLKCSKDKDFVATKTCPCCLSLMQPGGKHDREKYFGEPHLYYSARLYYCTYQDCKFLGIADEWDQ